MADRAGASSGEKRRQEPAMLSQGVIRGEGGGSSGGSSGGGDGGGGDGGGGTGSSGALAEVPLSALECGVCLSLVCQPVNLSCGHSFCRVCLVNTFRRNKKKCPTCRAVCHNSAEDQPEDVMLANIARTCFPVMYEKRLREVQVEREHFMAVLPVFYYNVVMFPGETLSLHLFEPRYKLMMQRIVSTSRRFAFVPNFSNYNASIGDVALVAEVRECEFLSDGRALLVAKMVSPRQTVVDHFIEESTQGLHYCRLEERVDAPLADPSAAAQVAELHQKTITLTNRIIEPIRQAQIVNKYGAMPATAEGLSLWVTAFLPMAISEKHALLAGTSTLARLSACEGYLLSLEGSAPPAPSHQQPVAEVAEAYARHLAAGGAPGGAPDTSEEGGGRGGQDSSSGSEEG